jgi:hypothetical protein
VSDSSTGPKPDLTVFPAVSGEHSDPLFDEPKPAKARTARLHRTSIPFVRVPVHWIADDRLFNARSRVLLLLLHESRWGQRKVELTSALAWKAGVGRRDKTRCVSYLEKAGLIRVERVGRAAFVITVVVDRFVAA